MEKYTDLEQVIQDSSLAIITEDITTQRELNRTFRKFKNASQMKMQTECLK